MIYFCSDFCLFLHVCVYRQKHLGLKNVSPGWHTTGHFIKFISTVFADWRVYYLINAGLFRRIFVSKEDEAPSSGHYRPSLSGFLFTKIG